MTYETNARAIYTQVHSLRDMLEEYRVSQGFSIPGFAAMLNAVAAEFGLHSYLLSQQAVASQASRIIKPEYQS
jgi:hypothetical protein